MSPFFWTILTLLTAWAGHGKALGWYYSRMPSTPDAQLPIVDLDHLQAGKLRLAFGAGKPLLLPQAWRVTRSGAKYHG